MWGCHILSITVPLSVRTRFKLIKHVGEKIYVNKILFLSTPCSPSSDFSGTAVVWNPLLALKSRTCLSRERSLCWPPKIWGQLNQGGKISPDPHCRFYIASAGFSAMIQEPMAITRARYSRPSNVTADDKARLPVSLSTTLRKEPDAGTEVPPSSSKHSKKSYFAKGVGLVLEKFNPNIPAHCPCHSYLSHGYEIKFPKEKIILKH